MTQPVTASISLQSTGQWDVMTWSHLPGREFAPDPPDCNVNAETKYYCEFQSG